MSLAYHIRRGLREGYPLCCVLRWSWTHTRSTPMRMQALERGVCRCETGSFVPCGVFHQPEMTTDEYREALA